MASAIFSTSTESYQISHIAYAGPVSEIPEDRRKSDCTHSFRLITSAGSSRCYYRSLEAARKARSALTAMLSTLKPHALKHGGEIIDPKMVVSFGTVVKLKGDTNRELTHGVPLTLESRDDQGAKIWLLYRSEENAQKGRRALYAVVHAANELTSADANRADREVVGKEAVPA